MDKSAYQTTLQVASVLFFDCHANSYLQHTNIHTLLCMMILTENINELEKPVSDSQEVTPEISQD